MVNFKRIVSVGVVYCLIVDMLDEWHALVPCARVAMIMHP